ncbi:MAG: hypothetical protein ABGU93_03030 [Acetobacterium sp.]|uniref:hypothetical protein n=1 Tax=Acetobacterium sp. TaxID=1872094 RepID=UPI00324266ED
MDIFFSDGINLMDMSSELRGECFKDFVRVDCPHRLTCRYADLEKKKHCVGYLFDYRHHDGASMVALKCARAKKVVMVRIDNHHHSFLELGSPELLDFESQREKIRCPNCDQRLFDAVVENKLDLRFKCSRDNRQLVVLLSENHDAEPEVTQN